MTQIKYIIDFNFKKNKQYTSISFVKKSNDKKMQIVKQLAKTKQIL